MTKHELAQVYFEKCAERILRILLLTEYTVSFDYEPTLKSTMEIDVDHKYLTGEIAFGNKAVKLFMNDPDEAFACVLHECMHIITTRLSEGRGGRSAERFLELEESTTEHITRIVFKLYKRKI